jgi:hypothetical protein
MDMTAIGAISGIPDALKTAYGIMGMFKYGNVQRPNYQIPEGVGTAENIYKYLSGSDMPGMQNAQNNIFQSQANATDTLMNGVGSSASLLNKAPSLQTNTNNSLNQLGVENAQFKQGNTQNLAGFEAGTKANYEDKAWQINKEQPFLDDQKAHQEAVQNTFGGLTGMGKDVLNTAEAGSIMDMLDAKKKTETPNNGTNDATNSGAGINGFNSNGGFGAKTQQDMLISALQSMLSGKTNTGGDNSFDFYKLLSNSSMVSNNR